MRTIKQLLIDAYNDGDLPAPPAEATTDSSTGPTTLYFFPVQDRPQSFHVFDENFDALWSQIGAYTDIKHAQAARDYLYYGRKQQKTIEFNGVQIPDTAITEEEALNLPFTLKVYVVDTRHREGVEPIRLDNLFPRQTHMLKSKLVYKTHADALAKYEAIIK